VTDLIINNRYDISTPSGFKDFYGIRKLNKDVCLLIEFSNGKSLKCSINHPFISKGSVIFANSLKKGSAIDSENNTSVFVVSIEEIKSSITLFDIINVSDGNIFNVDGLVSHNCDFTTTGHTVIDTDTLKWIKENGIKEPLEKRFSNQSLWIWEYPDYSKQYIVCADVARGDGGDYSAFHVLEINGLKQVAEFKGAVDTKTYGNILVSVANEFNRAILVIENNSYGWATIQQVIDLQYPNTFYSSADLLYVDLERQINNKINRTERNMVPGFTTTNKTRPLIISKLVDYFREKSITINSLRLYEELSVFIWNGSKPEAMGGYNDDLVTSLAMGLWVRDTALRLQNQTGEYTKNLINSINKTGGSEVIYTAKTQRAENYWSMDMPSYSKNTGNNKQREDLKWLL